MPSKGWKTSWILHRKHLRWHKMCYSQFTDKNRIQRLQKSLEKTLQSSRSSTPISGCDAGSSGDTDESLTRKPCKTRHQTKPVIKELCIFCQAESHKEQLRFVSTFPLSNRVLETAQLDSQVSVRLSGISDLIAFDGKPLVLSQ